MPEPLADPVVIPEIELSELDPVDAWDELLAFEQAEEVLEPPPSKAALEAVFGHGICSGLNPGGMSSVAPSGMLPELEEEDGEGVVPSGEVVPMPGVWLACALAETVLADHKILADHKVAANMHEPRIEVPRVERWLDRKHRPSRLRRSGSRYGADAPLPSQTLFGPMGSSIPIGVSPATAYPHVIFSRDSSGFCADAACRPVAKHPTPLRKFHASVGGLWRRCESAYRLVRRC